MYPFQKTEEHSYDTELTECLESSVGGESASCGGNQQRGWQRCETVSDGKSGDGLSQLASWKERLEEACRLRPTNTHLLLGASKVKYPFS